MIDQRGSAFVKVILVIIVILLVALIALGGYIYFSIRPFLADFDFPFLGGDEQDISADATGGSTATNSTAPVDKNPLLTAEQEQWAESMGIDPAKLPTEITPAMQACFVEKLGQERVMQIMNGDAPSAIDLFKAQSCL